MFLFLRILFVTLVLLWAFCYWKERHTGNLYWRRARRWVIGVGIAALLIMVIGLFIERLMLT